MKTLLELALIAAAFGQFCIALLNLRLVRILQWEEDLARIPLLLREVFHVHAWFITVTLLIFSTLTFRFAADLAVAATPIHRWLACSIGGFWAIRTVLQVTYYSSSHWRGIAVRTAVHVILLVVYSGFTAVYLTAGLRQ